MTFTLSTSFNFCASFARAIKTYFGFIDFNLYGSTVVSFMKIDCSLGYCWFHLRFLFWSSVSSLPPEKHIKYIAHSTLSSLFTHLSQSFKSILVVEFSFLRISQNFISSINFFELLFISSSVRMMFDSQFFESLFDILLTGCFRYTQYFVEFFVIYFLRVFLLTKSFASKEAILEKVSHIYKMNLF